MEIKEEKKDLKKIKEEGDLPRVVICGRPNVGKSTLFNRLLGTRKAVVFQKPGTTRDRLYGEVEYLGKKFLVIDTGGITVGKKEEIIEAEMQRQIEIALKEADLILFVVEVKGLTKEDYEALEFLRRYYKKIILVVNKVDHKKMIEKIDSEVFSFGGVEGPVFVSAIHKIGIDELLDKIIEHLKFKRKTRQKEEEKINVAICGRPNVGKSSFLNKVLGERRVIVSEKPGTTRDVVDVEVEFENGKKIVFVDTPGIRRRGKILFGEEKFGVLRALNAIKKAEIVLLLIDGKEGITKQDLHIAHYALQAYCGIILVVNKWDLVEKEKKQEEYLAYLKSKISFLPWAPVVFTSALTGKNVQKVVDLIFEIDKERKKEVRIKELNKIIKEAILKHLPPKPKTAKEFPKIYYVTQSKGTPPTFVFMVNYPSLFHFSYRRYLENVIRENFGFWGTAIKMIFKGKKEKIKEVK